ncbi:MAG: sulfurtransferase TusA family protein [Bacillota bacterium]
MVASIQVDARGRSCPEPVMMAKKAVDQGHKEFMVLVDSEAARDNVSRFVKSQGLRVQVEERGDEYVLQVNG